MTEIGLFRTSFSVVKQAPTSTKEVIVEEKDEWDFNRELQFES